MIRGSLSNAPQSLTSTMNLTSLDDNQKVDDGPNNNNSHTRSVFVTGTTHPQRGLRDPYRSDKDVAMGEEEIPTIELKPEFAILSLDMFLDPAEAGTTSAIPKSTPGLTIVDNADYNALSQTVLYTIDEHSKPVRKRCRAAYLSATVVKLHVDDKLGLGIQKVRGVMQISSIRPGLFSEAPFQVGDKLVSINNASCGHRSVRSAASLLKDAVGLVTVVVENPNKDEADPQLVECMIRKPTPTAKTGLGLASTGTAGRILVSGINPQGIFADSLLSRRDRIVSINHTHCDHLLDAVDVARIIFNSPTAVTVLAERKSDSAAVVALEPTTTTTTRAAF